VRARLTYTYHIDDIVFIKLSVKHEKKKQSIENCMALKKSILTGSHKENK